MPNLRSEMMKTTTQKHNIMKHLFNTTNNTTVIEISERELSDLLLIINTACIYDAKREECAPCYEVDNKYWDALYEIREALRKENK